MLLDAAQIYDAARAMCGGRLLASQVEGLSGLIGAWTRDHAKDDPRWFAYILATVQHETARSFLPIEEAGCGAGKAYGTRFYGRGYCQLTWEANYARFGKLLGVDLVGAPERALDPALAGPILFRGMIDGLYTGRRLDQYIAGGRCNFVGARRVVNGEDKATLIASYARAYLRALGCGAEGAACSKAA
jgi:putative chitinase